MTGKRLHIRLINGLVIDSDILSDQRNEEEEFNNISNGFTNKVKGTITVNINNVLHLIFIHNILEMWIE